MTRPKNLHAWINTILCALLLWLSYDTWRGLHDKARSNADRILFLERGTGINTD